jgi:4-alpha-glucanotransferase
MAERSEAGDKAGDQVLRTSGWGIDLNYKDAFGKWHDTPEETISAILRAMDAETGAVAPPEDDSLLIACTGDQRELPSPATIVLESGETITASSRLPPELPAGYHKLQFDGSARETRLIISPGRCWLPEHLCTWGWAVQLYAARSRESWGIGDLGDLERLAKWSKELGAGMMLVNPLSAATPTLPQQSSPYYPTSRRFFNPLWIQVERVPAASKETIPQLEDIAKAGRELNQRRLIDRDKVFRYKMEALHLLWLEFPGDERFGRFCRSQGADLDRFATFCALAEHFQSGWHSWPARYQHPASSAVQQFAAEHVNRVQFHKWLQWLLDIQLAHCAEHIALMQDLPIGFDPDGADAWSWQDVIAKDVSVGAPPDEFNTQGQDWGLPPFVPHKLRAAGYEPFVQTIRAAFRNGGGLRIDHVMGLFRLFWIPAQAGAKEGTYVRYKPDEMLAIVALESERAKAYVVGEDLGTVEEGSREKLSHYGVMSYRLLWFEKDDPSGYPHDALAAVTTHDLPTVAGLWSGSDLEHQRKIGLKPNEESTSEIHGRLAQNCQLKDDSPLEDVIYSAYELLARAPSRIVTAALEDALAVHERPNMPATTQDKNPNWSRALPVLIEDIEQRPLPHRIAAALRRDSGVAAGAA